MVSEDESNHLIDRLYNYLIGEKRLAYFNSVRSELTVRCPYCGDSVNNKNHGHMYIAAVAPFSFYCQRCETKGFINFDTLREFEVDEPELAITMTKAARKAISSTTKTDRDITSFLTGKRKLILPEYNERSKYLQRRINYLEGRWETDLTLNDLKDLKVIGSTKKFIEVNNLKNMMKYYGSSEYNQQLLEYLERYAVGFLSTDTNYIGYRYIEVPNSGRRYYTESNNRPVDIGNRMYTISNDLDVMSPELNLILAEGVMDIGSIWINMYDRLKSPDTVFGAVNGRAYKMFIQEMRKLGFFKINLEIYSDREIDLNNYKYTLNRNHFNKIQIHYNTFKDEKDFGVPIDRIKRKTYRLK